MPRLYDEIGVGYSDHRRPDPRIAAAIGRALGDAETVVNVGAGAGSYEPTDRPVVAVEPSREMIRQRTPGGAKVVRADAAHLPFRDARFAASLAILTVHHWTDRTRGLAELLRVARQRAVIVTFDPGATGFWLVDDYFPEIRELDRQTLPSLAELRALSPTTEVHALPVPHDCTDGFLGAYWRRPHAYLDPTVRRAISAFSMIEDAARGVSRLRQDLADGTWERRHGALAHETHADLGYRVVIVGR